VAKLDCSRGKVGCPLGKSWDLEDFGEEADVNRSGEPSPGKEPRRSAEPSYDEKALAAGLIARDDAAFYLLVDRHHRTMIQVAWRYSGSFSVAEEIVQETWLAVVRRIQYFEHRSTLKTWIFRILLNIARRRVGRESRSISLSAFLGDPADSPGSAEEALTRAVRRSTCGKPWLRGALDHFPSAERRLLGGEVRQLVEEVLQQLPRRQSLVVSLRDLEGWSSQEVCDAMEVTASNQRVLLHRGRTKVREHLERIYETGGRK
jgi:RNA polymerase sigma-70 factor (ECF subfamily)